MASWILHLRLAEEILRWQSASMTDPGQPLDPVAFAVGNIAPDSGLPDEKWEHFNPPLEVTHFTREGVEWRCDDLSFYQRHLLPLRACLQSDLVSFRLGYFFHLLLDNLWDVRFNRPLRKRFAAQFAADPDFIWKIKADLYGLDFLHLKQHPDGLFWRVLLQAEAQTGGLDFLPLQAVQARLAYIRQYYTNAAEMQKACQRSYPYLTAGAMDDFVAESSAYVLRIYQYLWLEGAPAGQAASALDLVLPAEVPTP